MTFRKRVYKYEIIRITRISKICVPKVKNNCQQYGTPESFRSGGKHPTEMTGGGVLQAKELAKLQNK